jgi:NADH-quinone oxidoreductase subunit L
MGGLGRELPFTQRTFLAGALALAAVPPFAGFFSKDGIFASAANAGTLGWILWVAAAAGGFITAVYTFRLYFIVFHGEKSTFAQEHLHKREYEGGLAMAWPVAVLAVLAVVGGLIQVPGAWTVVDDWLHPVAESIEEATGTTFLFSLLITLGLELAGIYVAWRLWGRPSHVPAEARRRYPWAARTLEEKFYFDEAYQAAFYEPSDRTAVAGTRFVEEPLVLRSLRELGDGVRLVAVRVAAAQTGLVRSYALALAGGLAVLAVVFLVTAT